MNSNVLKIKELFPNCVTETKDKNNKITLKIDFETLKQELSADIIGKEEEKYEFTWPGKSKSILLANQPTENTLRPCKEESVNWDTTQNLYIEGDNLNVLKILRRDYLNKIKMIYIDPPYNTGKNRLYKDKFTHSEWLNMMYPRLKLARDLLTNDGVIFISIDYHEVHNLRKLCDEIFGEKNFICEFVRKSGNSVRLDTKYVSIENDYVLMYAKNKSNIHLNRMNLENDNNYNFKDKYFNNRGAYKLNKLDRSSIHYSKSLDYAITAPDGTLIYPGNSNKSNRWCWRWSKKKFDWGIKNDFIVIKKGKKGWSVYSKQYQFVDNSDNPISRMIPYKNLLIDKYFNENGTKLLSTLFDNKFSFDYPKPLELLLVLLNVVSLNSTNDVIMDFFSGSATTAHAVMKLNAEDGGNRKFIMIQLPEPCDEKSEAFKEGYKNICEIGKERIRRAGKKIIEETGKTNLDVGFRVFKIQRSS